MSPEKTVSHFICCSIRPGKSPERSHISSEPYEPISPPQAPVVHEKQDSVLLLAQRGAEPAEQRCVGVGRVAVRARARMCMLTLGAFRFPEVSAVFSLSITCQENHCFPSDQMLVDFTEEILIFK